MKNSLKGKMLTQVFSVVLCAFALILLAATLCPYYTIAELPEGYVYAEEKNDDGYRRIRYENENGQRIRLEYNIMETGSAFVVDTENMSVHNILVNGCSGQVFLSSDPKQGNAILWIDDDTNIQFFLNAFAEEPVLLHMAESVSLVKTAKP